MPAAPPSNTPTLPPEASRRAAHAVRRLLAPVQAFLAIEAASGILLIAATAAALIWANSPWRDGYHALWHTPIGLAVGDWVAVHSLHFWINDVLMTVFFFVVGLEIRREIACGELSTPRRAALPLAAALGGMLAPAAIYAAFNHGGAGAAGWGIPMATDIAFAVGVLALLGRRVPGALRVLLLALAVIDDIGAILVIAIFYSSGVSGDGFLIAGLGVAGVAVLQRIGVRRPALYLPVAVVVWAGFYAAGVHPTLAGVVLGLLTPARAWLGRDGFVAAVAPRLERATQVESHELLADLDAVEAAQREAVPPTEYLIHRLHGLVAFVIMPVFALANAGVGLDGVELTGAAVPVVLGVVLGLVVGKAIGIALACVASVRIGLAVRPGGASWRGIAVVGVVGGIGFTMSLFIAQLAFPPGPLLEAAKLGILIGSGVAAVLGLVIGRVVLRPPAAAPHADELAAERSDEH
jgi:Na+:H+ antiporter, NhaA family